MRWMIKNIKLHCISLLMRLRKNGKLKKIVLVLPITFYSSSGWLMYQKETQLNYIWNTHSPFLQECLNFLELQIQKQLLSVSPNILIELFTGYLIIA